MSLSAAYSMKKRANKMAKGGTVEDKGVHMPISGKGGAYSEGTSAAGLHARYEKRAGPGAGKVAKKEHEQVIAEARSNPKPTSGMSGFADGGEVCDHEKDADMIARIMHKRKEYSEGGMVANDVGVAEADKLPAEYDDLVLRDDLDGSQPEDSNEHGDDLPEDMVSRVMLKKKKDRMPRPA